ncbi:MAG TPA: hypothetical protein ENH29_04010 [Bacteroidetes bacterium]|nr:hypothetical protein [Bacteroidota bacterium]
MKLNRIKIVLILLGLTFLFIIDDVLFILLFKELELWQLSAAVYFAVSVVVFFLNLSLALVVYRALKRRPVTGWEGMIGKTGKALETLANSGQVLVVGEIWQAESMEKIRKGSGVKITGVSGLTLSVVKLKDH